MGSREERMAVQLVTFGGLRVLDGARELERLLSQRSRAALFIYLTIERRVSREPLTAMFWPESDAENARHALRQSLYHLRKVVGGNDWIDSRAHELVVCGAVGADATAFSDAVERGDTERAVRLYRGPFLDGVHLVDLRPWESWVDGRRAKYARLFRKACRSLLDARLAARDFAGAIAVAECWTARDPTDDEAQHRLIAALAAGGERAEALRQYETYARLLAPDGLEPLDETRELVERLRTRPALTFTWRIALGRAATAPRPRCSQRWPRLTRRSR
jgi:DNA-binding SARP family transcriptional activator